MIPKITRRPKRIYYRQKYCYQYKISERNTTEKSHSQVSNENQEESTMNYKKKQDA